MDDKSSLKTGYFIIADVSGYTSFLAESEVEHAKGILEELFKSLLPWVKNPLVISNFHGDAIFIYAEQSDTIFGQLILEAMDNLYCGFAAARRDMILNTTCPCNACRNIDNLDLKIAVHYGDFILQSAGGWDELTSKDVIATFRLLKNNVTEQTGMTAYAMLTDAAIGAMEMRDYFDPLPLHSEEYEHVGVIDCRLYDLAAVWKRREELTRNFIGQNDPQFIEETSCVLPLPRSAVWALVTEPSHRIKWQAGVESIEVDHRNAGRSGPDDVMHCAHGDITIDLTVVDWRPFEYVTFAALMPMNANIRQTFELEPVGNGTLLRVRYAELEYGGALSRLMWLAMAGKVKRQMSASTKEGSENLERYAKEIAEQSGTRPDALEDAALDAAQITEAVRASLPGQENPAASA